MLFDNLTEESNENTSNVLSIEPQHVPNTIPYRSYNPLMHAGSKTTLKTKQSSKSKNHRAAPSPYKRPGSIRKFGL